MSLFKNSGIVLKSGESVIKHGKFKGNVPEQKYFQDRLRIKVLGSTLMHAKHYEKIKWEDASGEIVLTNERILGFSEKGHLRKEVILSLELDIKNIKTVNTKKPFFGNEKLALSVDLGTQKPEMMEFEVDDAPDWVSAIRGQIK